MKSRIALSRKLTDEELKQVTGNGIGTSPSVPNGIGTSPSMPLDQLTEEQRLALLAAQAPSLPT